METDSEFWWLAIHDEDIIPILTLEVACYLLRLYLHPAADPGGETKKKLRLVETLDQGTDLRPGPDGLMCVHHTGPVFQGLLLPGFVRNIS